MELYGTRPRYRRTPVLNKWQPAIGTTDPGDGQGRRLYNVRVKTA